MMNKVTCVIILLINAMMSAFSQLLLKKSALEEHDSILRQYLNLNVIIGYIIFFLVLFLNIFVLKFLDISIVSSFSESMPMAFTLILSKLFLNESINKYKVFGVIIIIIGIYIIVL